MQVHTTSNSTWHKDTYTRTREQTSANFTSKWYGSMAALVQISHISTPKDHTSLLLEKIRFFRLSGAALPVNTQRKGPQVGGRGWGGGVGEGIL